MTHEQHADHDEWDALGDADDVPVVCAPDDEVGTIDPDAEFQAMLHHDDGVGVR